MNLTRAPGEGHPHAGPQAWRGGAAHTHMAASSPCLTDPGDHPRPPHIPTSVYTWGLGHTRLRGDSPCPHAALADPVLQERGYCPLLPQPTHGRLQNLWGQELLFPKWLQKSPHVVGPSPLSTQARPGTTCLQGAGLCPQGPPAPVA